jgi:hypothetical protein
MIRKDVLIFGVILLIGAGIAIYAVLSVEKRQSDFRDWAGESWHESGISRPK